MDETNPESTSKTTDSEAASDDDPTKPYALRHNMTGDSRLLVGGILKNWAEVSRLNYLENLSESFSTSRVSLKQSLSKGRSGMFSMLQSQLLYDIWRNTEDIPIESFPHNVTPLMNEEQLWGCFYNFPELYDDSYSPLVRILHLTDEDELVGGVLTRDMVAACLSYLHRVPILRDFVCIKLNLMGKRLQNIDVLQHFKYLVYLDLSSNLLSDLKVLSHLLYLQYLSVDYNRLETVLEYDTPQWFLTEVHYKYNSLKRIRDITIFWSITILDLSHNNIKCIAGLENLRYLRHLDLSFNHIQRFENLNHLRLLWLDLSYNNISSFELGKNVGLWTLLHLDFLNLNENNLKSMKIFSGCTRLRELHVRNNRLGSPLELAVYMRQLRRLTVLDLRANPICSMPGYEHVVYETFPLLLTLDAVDLDPVKQRRFKMETWPDVITHASRRLLRLLFIEQLTRARVPITPPADTEEVPLVVFVGQEAVGKGTLARKLAAKCDSKIKLGLRHTTATHHNTGHYIEVTRQKFDDMILAGEFLTYTEIGGESYGLSREEAFISDGKVCVCTMDLISALMLKLRGRRPFLILTHCHDKTGLAGRQGERKLSRDTHYEKRMSYQPLQQPSTLQVMLSGRFIITGILNEIIMSLTDDNYMSDFSLDSECSLLMESQVRQTVRPIVRGDLLTLLTVSSSAMSVSRRNSRCQDVDPSLYSIYKTSQDSSTMNPSYDEDRKNGAKKRESGSKPAFGMKTTDGGPNKSGSRQIVLEGANASKSVTFTAPDIVSGIVLDPNMEISELADKADQKSKGISISKTFPGPPSPEPGTSTVKATYEPQPEDADLWLAFLTETGLAQISDSGYSGTSPSLRYGRKVTITDTPDSILQQLSFYHQTPAQTTTTTLRDEYESIHTVLPGLFHDTISMDDDKEAFRKAKTIIRDIVNSQDKLGPMFDIDFANNLDYYPTVSERLEEIRQEIAPRHFFY